MARGGKLTYGPIDVVIVGSRNCRWLRYWAVKAGKREDRLNNNYALSRHNVDCLSSREPQNPTHKSIFALYAESLRMQMLKCCDVLEWCVAAKRNAENKSERPL
jgi:hypothetical protein